MKLWLPEHWTGYVDRKMGKGERLVSDRKQSDSSVCFISPMCADAHVQETYVHCPGMRSNVRSRQADSGTLARQALMHVFIRAWGEAERTGQ